jgi:predicted transcriptional regulator
MEQSLDEMAKTSHRSKNWIINEAVREYLERIQLEAERWRETLEALDAVRAGDVIDGERVHQWLESWGKESRPATE